MEPPWSPHGAPPGGYLWKIPSGAPAYLLWHVGYQFYSDFSKENESRDDTTLFWMGLPQVWPRGATPGYLEGPLSVVSTEVDETKACWVYIFYSDFSKDNESRVDTTLFWIGLPRGWPIRVYPEGSLIEVSSEVDETKAWWVSILLRFQKGKRIQGWHTIILNGTPTRGWPIGVYP